MTNRRGLTPPWRFTFVRALTRFFALALSAVDGVISFQGLNYLGFPLMASITLATMILIFQAAVALTLTSGAPVGEEFQTRFFGDSGLVGMIKRAVGVLIILLGVAIYLTDIWTNYSALTQGDDLAALIPFLATEETIEPIALVPLACAILLSIGDEICNLLADLLALNEPANSRGFRETIDEDLIVVDYRNAKRRAARERAIQAGQEHGSTWDSGRR